MVLFLTAHTSAVVSCRCYFYYAWYDESCLSDFDQIGKFYSKVGVIVLNIFNQIFLNEKEK